MEQILKLKEFREYLRLNQRELAKLMNMSQANYQRLESGISQPNAKQIVKFCEILKCTPNDLFGFKGVHKVLMDELDSE